MKTYIVHVLEIHDNPTFVQAEDEADAIIRIRKGEGIAQGSECLCAYEDEAWEVEETEPTFQQSYAWIVKKLREEEKRSSS